MPTKKVNGNLYSQLPNGDWKLTVNSKGQRVNGTPIKQSQMDSLDRTYNKPSVNKPVTSTIPTPKPNTNTYKKESLSGYSGVNSPPNRPLVKPKTSTKVQNINYLPAKNNNKTFNTPRQGFPTNPLDIVEKGSLTPVKGPTNMRSQIPIPTKDEVVDPSLVEKQGTIPNDKKIKVKNNKKATVTTSPVIQNKYGIPTSSTNPSAASSFLSGKGIQSSTTDDSKIPFIDGNSSMKLPSTNTSNTPPPSTKEEKKKWFGKRDKSSKSNDNGVNAMDIANLGLNKANEYLANKTLKDMKVPVLAKNDYVTLDKDLNINGNINSVLQSAKEAKKFIKSNSTNSNSANARVVSLEGKTNEAMNNPYQAAANFKAQMVNTENTTNNQIKTSNNQIDYENATNVFNKKVQTDVTNRTAMGADTYDKLNALSKDNKLAAFQKEQIAAIKEVNPAYNGYDDIMNGTFKDKNEYLITRAKMKGNKNSDVIKRMRELDNEYGIDPNTI